MKKYIMSFLAALFTLTGCYDLDRAPYDQLSSSTFWQTEDQCKQGMHGSLRLPEKHPTCTVKCL